MRDEFIKKTLYENDSPSQEKDKTQVDLFYAFSCCNCDKSEEIISRLNKCGMIVVPSTFFQNVDPSKISLPLCVKVNNIQVSSTKRDVFTHCGIWDYSAPEGIVYVPGWVMKRLSIKYGEMVRLEPAILPAATSALLVSPSPMKHLFRKDRDFSRILIENYDFLTTNDLISIQFQFDCHCFNVLVTDVKPDGAACVLIPEVVKILWDTFEGTQPPVAPKRNNFPLKFRSNKHWSPRVRVVPEIPFDSRNSNSINTAVYYASPIEETYPDYVQEVTDYASENNNVPTQIASNGTSNMERKPVVESLHMSRTFGNLYQSVNNRATTEVVGNSWPERNHRALDELPSMSETLGKSMLMSIHY
uniref:Tudor domain-containing protein n=1 Tax=Angiostrongylus cantonensis TaxID=6313 RepID=A0A0K0DL80_ANGCA